MECRGSLYGGRIAGLYAWERILGYSALQDHHCSSFTIEVEVPCLKALMKRNNSTLLRAHSRGSFNRLIFESEHANGAGHASRSLLFRLAQILVLIIRVITPAAYLYLSAWAYFKFGPETFSGGPLLFYILTIWMLIEAFFFPYYYYIFTHLSIKTPQLNHFGSTVEKRRKLVVDCFDALDKASPPNISSGYNCTDAQRYCQRMIEGWFLNVPIQEIKRDNFALWCGWAFFDKDMSTMTESEKSECNWIVSYVEKKANWRFPPGFDPAIVSARLTFDPLFATQRPFFFYLTIAVVNYLTHGILWLVGYSRRREYDVGSQSIYHRPSRAAKKGLPIIFIHGIGIGFPHYLGLILSFPQDCDVYLVEWPHVAMQFSYSVPTIDDTVGTITRVLRDDRHPAACFIGHSLGTTAVSWMLKSASAHLVASSILIDPVTFLLCDPTVATSFVYNDPETTLDFMMHFFVSRELFIANALSRHFNWSQNIMFVEDLAANVRDNPISEALPTVQHTIILARHDTIVPTAAVERYLKLKVSEGHRNYEVVTFDGTHGQIMLHPSWINYIVTKTKLKCDCL